MLALCWHIVPTYYALNYAGIFDGGLVDCMHMLYCVFLSDESILKCDIMIVCL